MKKSFSIFFIGRAIVLVAFVLCACASSFAQNIVYDISDTNLIAFTQDLCNVGDRYACGSTPSITWMSTGTGSVVSASVKFYQTYIDGAGGDTYLNSALNNPYNSPLNYDCILITPFTFTLDSAGYNVGGANTLQIDMGGACWILYDSIPGVFAQVTVTYDSISSGTPTWNGTANWTDNPNWTNGTPDASDSVVVQSGTLTVDTDVTVTDLTLENGATLVVEPGNTLTVTGEYINNGGTFTVQTGGEIAFQGVMKKNGAIRARNFGALKVKSGEVRLAN